MLTRRDTVTFSWVAATSIIVAFVYPWILAAVDPRHCDGACKWASVRGVVFAIARTVLGLGAASLAILLLLDVSGAY